MKSPCIQEGRGAPLALYTCSLLDTEASPPCLIPQESPGICHRTFEVSSIAPHYRRGTRDRWSWEVTSPSHVVGQWQTRDPNPELGHPQTASPSPWPWVRRLTSTEYLIHKLGVLCVKIQWSDPHRTHTRVYTHTYAHICTCTHAYMHLYLYTHTHMCKNACT